jgi:hypothetical protein
MANREGQWFEIWRSVIQAGLKLGTLTSQGIPTLTAKDLKRPQKTRIFISNGIKWTRVEVGRASYIYTPDARVIRFLPDGGKGEPGNLSADLSKPWQSSSTGAALLGAPGEWYVQTPVLPGDVEGTPIVALISDAALAQGGEGLAGVIGEAATVTMDPPQNGTATDTDAAVIPARPGRKFLSINTIQSTTNLRLGFGVAASATKGDFVPKGGRYVLTANPGEVLDSRAIHIRREDAIAGALALTWQEGG